MPDVWREPAAGGICRSNWRKPVAPDDLLARGSRREARRLPVESPQHIIREGCVRQAARVHATGTIGISRAGDGSPAPPLQPVGARRPRCGVRLPRIMPDNEPAHDASVPFELTRTVPAFNEEQMVVYSVLAMGRVFGGGYRRSPMDGATRALVTPTSRTPARRRRSRLRPRSPGVFRPVVAAAVKRCEDEASLVSGLGPGRGRRHGGGARGTVSASCGSRASRHRVALQFLRPTWNHFAL